MAGVWGSSQSVASGGSPRGRFLVPRTCILIPSGIPIHYLYISVGPILSLQRSLTDPYPRWLSPRVLPFFFFMQCFPVGGFAKLLVYGRIYVCFVEQIRIISLGNSGYSRQPQVVFLFRNAKSLRFCRPYSQCYGPFCSSR